MLSAQGTKQTSVSWAVLYNLCWAQCSARTFPLMFHLGLLKYTVLKDTPGQTSDGEVEAEPMLSFFLKKIFQCFSCIMYEPLISLVIMM